MRRHEQNEAVSFLLVGVGDTLFKGSCGRTDLPGGNAVHLKESLKKLRNLPPETTALSGHGESTTIGHEINTNFYMR